MKKLIGVLFACALGLALAGCAKEYDDSAISQRLKNLEDKVSKLETQVANLNSQVEGVNTTINEWKKGGFIEKIQEIEGGYTISFLGGKTVTLYNGKDGKDGNDGEDGHTPEITIGANGNWFIDGKDTGKPSQGAPGDPGDPGDPGEPGEDGHSPEVTIGENGNWFIDGEDTGVPAKGKDGEDGEDGENGADGVSPTIVSKDGELYWALDGELILVDGKPVPATVLPTFSIDKDGHLIMTISGKDYDLGIVRGASGDSMLKDIKANEDSVVFTLSDDTTIEIPFAKAFQLVIDTTEMEVAEGETVTIKYEVKNADESTVVDAFANGFYQVKVDQEKSELKVYVPKPATAGQVLVWAQNNKGLSSMVKLNFDVKADVKVVTENIDKVSGDDGLLEVKVTSNLPIEVEAPSVDWLILKDVKSTTYTITFQLKANETGAPRTTKVNILRADTGEVVQTITIGQLAQVLDGRVVIDFNAQGYTTGKTVEKITVDGVTVTFAKGSGTVLPEYSASFESLTVKPNNTMTISASKAIQKVAFTMAPYDGTDAITADSGTMTTAPVTWEAASETGRVTFTFAGQRRLAKLTVTLGDPITQVQRVWGYYSSKDAAWSDFISGFTANSDRNVAMDDDYIYIAESNATKNLWAISRKDGKTVKKVKTDKVKAEGLADIALMCPRVIKNTDASINGGKDVLVVSNLATDQKINMYMYVNGIDKDPNCVTFNIWADRRLGDTWTYWGTFTKGMYFFKDYNDASAVMTFKQNAAGNWADGASNALQARLVMADGTGAGAYWPYPDDKNSGVYGSRGDTRIAYLVTTAEKDGKKIDVWTAEGGNDVVKTPLSGYYTNTAYQFIEFNGKRYVAYTRQVDGTDGRLMILEGAGTDKWDDIITNKNRRVIYKAAIQEAAEMKDDYNPSPRSSGHSGMDLCARVIGNEVYIAVIKQNVGLSLFKLYSEK